MLSKILIIFFGLLTIATLESFFMTLFTFSLMIMVLLVLIDKIEWKIWVIITFFLTLFVDVLFHRALGLSMMAVSVSISILYLLFLVMPKKDNILSHIPYFLSTAVFYILIDLLAPFLQDRVWGVITADTLLSVLIRAVVSTLVIFVINILISNFRSNRDYSL